MISKEDLIERWDFLFREKNIDYSEINSKKGEFKMNKKLNGFKGFLVELLKVAAKTAVACGIASLFYEAMTKRLVKNQMTTMFDNLKNMEF